MTWIARDLTRVAVGLAAIGLAAGLIVATSARPALASHASIDASSPGEVTVGGTTEVLLTMKTATGARLPGTTIVVSQHVSFAGVEGYAEIGRVVTDANGDASVAYRPRSAGQHELRMQYTSSSGETETTTMLVSASGGAQLVHAPAGIDVPGVGVELIMVVLAVVWSILFSVALRLVAVARAAGNSGARGTLAHVRLTV
jgi:hypothetical protein